MQNEDRWIAECAMKFIVNLCQRCQSPSARGYNCSGLRIAHKEQGVLPGKWGFFMETTHPESALNKNDTR